MNGIPPTTSELFRRTHQRRKDNSWVDKKSEQVNVMDYYLLRFFSYSSIWFIQKLVNYDVNRKNLHTNLKN